MDTVIRLVGVIFAFVAIVHLVKPDVLVHILEFLKQGKRMYFTGLIRLVLGAVFLLGARECRISWVIIVFGILLIMKGLVVFVIGPAKLKSKLDWGKKQSNLRIRAFALIALAFVAIMIYSA